MQTFASTSQIADRKPASVFAPAWSAEKKSQAFDTATSSFLPIPRKTSCACGGGCPSCQGKLSKRPLLSGRENANAVQEGEDPIHQPLIDRFRADEHLPPGGRDEAGIPVGPSDAEIKYDGLGLPCPRSTEVAQSIDLRTEGLAAGFGTAYGIHALMRVRPDGRTWDGTQIPESLTTQTTSCPESLTRGNPCSGDSTFIVGSASGNSSVLASPRPGARNRFWDFHTTHVRPRDVSVLHDPSRNPQNIDSCSTVCNQQYHCGGNIIGRHTITRTFTKGVHNGRDVTFVDVVKT